MRLLQMTNNIIRSLYYDQLYWRKLSDGFIASTHIPESGYQETTVIHSVNLLNQFLRNPTLGNKFKISRTKAPQGQIIHITADGSTSQHMRENKVTGLTGVMIKEHASLADALITTQSQTQGHLHIEFPELTKLKDSVDPAFMDTIRTLVHDACWFKLALGPTVHIRDTTRNADLVSEQINNLGLFNPVRAQYAHDIVSVTNAPLVEATSKVSRLTASTEAKETKSVILRDNNQLKPF